MGGNPLQILINVGTMNLGNAATLPQQLGIGLMTGGPANAGGLSTGVAGLPTTEIVIVSRNPLPADVLKDLQVRLPRELGPLRIVVATPAAVANAPASLPLEVGDLHSLQTLLANPGLLMEALMGAQAEPQALTSLLQGSQNVYPMPQRPQAETPAPGLQRFLTVVTEMPATVRPETPASSGESKLPVAADRGAAAHGSESVLPKGATQLSTVKIPEVVRDVLVRLQILPAGVSTEQALPRLQEVMRLWGAGTAQHSDLPAEVVRVVSQFFASAALAMATANPQTLASALPLRPGTSPEAQRGPSNGANASGHPLFGDASRSGLRFGTLTRGDIATAVLSALNGTPTLMPSAQPGKGLPGANTETPAQHASGLPGANPSQGKVPGEKDVAAGRLIEGTRADAGLDRSVRDAKPQTRLTGEEGRERAIGEETALEKRRSAHDQESHHAGGEQEAAAAIDALWTDLHAALDRAGFIESGTLRRLLDAVEARSFLRVLAARVPDGMDLIDVVTLVDVRIGLSPETGGVNAALRRLADYRAQGRKDKTEALMEPLRDAFVVMDMIDADLMPVQEAELSLEDLRGFETFASIAQMTLAQPSWTARAGMTSEDKNDLERLVGDIDRLVENVHERFEQLSVTGLAANGPEYFRDTIRALPH